MSEDQVQHRIGPTPSEPQSHRAFEFGASIFCDVGLSPYAANLLGLALCSGEEYLHTYLSTDWANRQQQVVLTDRLDAILSCTYVDCYGIDEDDLVGTYSDDEPNPGIIADCEPTLVLDNVDEIQSDFQCLYKPMTSQQYTAYADGERTTVDASCTVIAIAQLDEPAERYSTYRDMLSFEQKAMSLFDLVILPTIGPGTATPPPKMDLEEAAEHVAVANDCEPSISDDIDALLARVEQTVEGDTVSRRYADLRAVSRAAARVRHGDAVSELDVRAASKLLFDTDIIREPESTDADVILTGANQPELNRHQFTLQVLETMQEDYFIGVPYDDIRTVMVEDYLIDEEEVENTLEMLKENGDVRKIRDRYRAR